MKFKLIIFFLIPNLVSAQLRFESLLNSYKYTCNCFESLIVQGTPKKIKYHSKNKNVSIFQVQIDTIFYLIDSAQNKDKNIFIVSNKAETSNKILKSNLFVLRRCFYCDIQNPTKCRPLKYYEIIDAVRNNARKLEIIRQQDPLNQCVNCQAIRPIKRKNKKIDFEKLDKIEKFIDKKSRKISR